MKLTRMDTEMGRYYEDYSYNGKLILRNAVGDQWYVWPLDAPEGTIGTRLILPDDISLEALEAIVCIYA